MHEHEADRPCADHHDAVSSLGPRLLQAAHYAGQRFGQRRMLQGQTLRDNERVLGHDAGRDADVLGVSAVVEEQVLAQVFLFADAPEAGSARRRIQRHHPHPWFEAAHAGAGLMDHSRQLMPEERRRRDHPGMVPAAEDFQVGTASESGVNADDNLPLTCGGNRNPFNPDVFFAVEHGSVHLT